MKMPETYVCSGSREIFMVFFPPDGTVFVSPFPVEGDLKRDPSLSPWGEG